MLVKQDQNKVRIITEVIRKHHSFAPPQPSRICAYVRVSTGHDKQLNSLRSQTTYYENKFLHLPNHIIVGIFSDAGISGAKENRPGFLAMLKQAKAGEIDLIYTKSISRFARNTLMLLQTVRELRAIGVGIIFEEQNINTLSNEGELMLTMLASIAEEECKSVRTNVQWAMRKKFLRGEVMVDTNRLLGFDKDNSGNLVINPEQARIVRLIFDLYLNGMTAYEIAKVLNAQNIPSYANDPWQSSRVLSIISNEKYIGDCLLQKSFINEYGRQVPNLGQRDRFWVDAAHPAIISRSDWDLAQLIRRGRAKKSYPFSSLLRCAFCGSTLIRVSQSGRWVSWICGRYMHQGKAACVGSRITESRLIALTKDQPITEPTIVEEVHHEPYTKSRRQKSYRLIPVSNNPAK
jgi:site-specific DNA recombinase